MQSSKFIVSENVIPHLIPLAKKADAAAWKHIQDQKMAVFNNILKHEIDLMRIEDAHRRIVHHFLKDGVSDSLDNFTGIESNEKNVWAAFQQVGPIPSVSQANTKDDEQVTKFGIPFKSLFWPCQGSKIWDWMRGARPEDVLPKLKKPVSTPQSKVSTELKPLQVKESPATAPSESSSEVSTPRSVSPIESSSSATSSDSEDNNAPSSASSDSGFGSMKSGSTSKKMKKYKVFTAEEIEKRDKIVDEWKKKIQAALCA